jgi:hypothetical protein
MLYTSHSRQSAIKLSKGKAAEFIPPLSNYNSVAHGHSSIKERSQSHPFRLEKIGGHRVNDGINSAAFSILLLRFLFLELLAHHLLGAVPDVVVREPVHVGLELATVHVHVGDEQKRNVRSTIRTTGVWTCEQTPEFYAGLRSPPGPLTNKLFFIKKLNARALKISHDRPDSDPHHFIPDFQSHNRRILSRATLV